MVEVENKIIVKINNVPTEVSYTSVNEAIAAIKIDTTADATYTLELGGVFAEEIAFNFGDKNVAVTNVDGQESTIKGKVTYGDLTSSTANSGDVTISGLNFDYTQAVGETRFEVLLFSGNLEISECEFVGPGVIDSAACSNPNGGNLFGTPWTPKPHRDGQLIVSDCSFEDGNVNFWRSGNDTVWTFENCEFIDAPLSILGASGLTNTGYSLSGCTFQMDFTNIPKEMLAYCVNVDQNAKALVITNSTFDVKGDFAGEYAGIILATAANNNSFGANIQLDKIIVVNNSNEKFFANLSSAQYSAIANGNSAFVNTLVANNVSGVSADDLAGIANVTMLNLLEDGKLQIISSNNLGEVKTTTADNVTIYADANAVEDLAAGKVLGYNTFTDINSAVAAVEKSATTNSKAKLVIAEGSSVKYTDNYVFMTVPFSSDYFDAVATSNTYAVDVNGEFSASIVIVNGNTMTVSNTGLLRTPGEGLRSWGGTLTVNGNRQLGEAAATTKDLLVNTDGSEVVSFGGFIVGTNKAQVTTPNIRIAGDGVFNFNNTDVVLSAMGNSYGIVGYDNTKGTLVLNNSNFQLYNSGGYGSFAALDVAKDGSFTLKNSNIIELDTSLKTAVNNSGVLDIEGISSSDAEIVNNGTLNIKADANFTANDGIQNNNIVNILGAKLEVETLTNSGSVNVSGTNTLNINTITGNAISLAGTLVNSYIGGKVHVVGNSTISGDEDSETADVTTVTDTNIKVNNGATLTVAAGATLSFAGDGYKYLFVGDDKYDSEKYIPGDSGKGGSLVINGTANTKQINVNAGGVVTVNGTLTCSTLNLGGISGRKGGDVTIQNGAKATVIQINIGMADSVLTVTGNETVLKIDNGNKSSHGFINNTAGTVNVSNGGSIVYDLTSPGSTLQNDDGITNQSIMNVLGGSLIVESTKGIKNSGTLTLGNFVAQDNSVKTGLIKSDIVDNSGTINISGGALEVETLTNSGTVNVSNEITLTGNVNNSGTINVDATTLNATGTVNNDGTIALKGNAQVNFDTFDNADGVLALDSFTGTLENVNGSVKVLGQSTIVDSIDVTLISVGDWETWEYGVAENDKLTIRNNATISTEMAYIQSAGTLTIAEKSTLKVNGSFSNYGKVAVDGDLEINGNNTIGTSIIGTDPETRLDNKNTSVTVTGKLTLSKMEGASAFDFNVNEDASLIVDGGQLQVDNGVTVNNYGNITISNQSIVNATIKGNAVEIASGAQLSGTLTSNVELKGNISIVGNGMINGAITGNKNITLVSGANATDKVGLNFKGASEINNLTISGKIVLMGTANYVKTITVDGSATMMLSIFNLAALGTSAITGKNNAQLTANANDFGGNKVSKVALTLTGVNFANGVALDIDNVSNIKSINGEVVSGNTSFGYSVQVGDKIYSLIDGNASGLIFEEISVGAGSAQKDEYSGSLDNVVSNIVVEGKEGTAKLTVSKNANAVIGGIAQNANGGINNITLGNAADLTVNGDVEAVGKLSTGNGASIELGDTTGTNLNTSFNLGKQNNATIANIDMMGGNNTLSLGAETTLAVDNNVDNVKTIKLANGSYNKKTNETKETILDIDGDITAPEMKNAITIGNYAKLIVGGNLINSDLNVGSTIKAGKYSTVDFAGNLTSVANLTIGANGTLKAGNITGTIANDTINLGANMVEVSTLAIDMKGGKNTLSIGACTDMVITGNLANVSTLKLANGSYDKKTNLTNETSLDINGDLVGVNANVNVGSYAKLEVESMTDVNKLTIGKNSTLEISGSFNGTAKNDTITLSNDLIAATIKSINLGNGNDKLSIGNNVDLKSGDINFGDGKDTLVLGKNASLTANTLDGIETINASKGAMLILKNGTADIDFDNVKGSWKNATILDMGGVINDDGSFSGATYSNEWDIFEFVANANGEFNVELTESATFKIFDANNTLLNDNLAVEGNKYYLAVNVTSDLNKANDKDNTFSGIITIA